MDKKRKPSEPAVAEDSVRPDRDGGAGKAEGSGRPEAWPVERGGPKGPEPTRYGDWEKAGRCTDF